ncbi:MAG TPA: hypothetical protein VHF47_02875 [Acidimicrobiales bacterium]|nr:hypothetical protein [Acidimicrobiales bacterium]
MAAAVLAVCAFGSVPAFAQLPVGTDVTVPLPIDGGMEGSTPDPTTTTTTTTAPSVPPSTAPTTAPAPAPALGRTSAEAPTPAAGGGATETARRQASTGRRASGRVRATSGPIETFDVAPAAVADDEPTIARLRQVTLPAARQFGFPLGLAALVLAFLAVQGRLDARDPKLAAAPLSVDDDLLPFA